MPTPTAVRPRLDRERLQPEVLRQRLAGTSYREIGRQLDISHMSAWVLVRELLDAPTTSDADRLRLRELERLDQRLAALTRRRAALGQGRERVGA